MRIMDCLKGTLYVAATVVSLAGVASAQASPQVHSRPEIAASFDYVRSNAPVGGGGCFGIYGGNATFALPLHDGPLALVAEAGSGVSSNIAPGGYSLMLSRFTAGIRYTPYLAASRLHPFAQITGGVAHASQSLVASSTASNAAATLALNFGGGVDLDLNRRFSVRLAQVSYLLTTFDNGSNNLQNNLRLDAGIVVHF